MHSVITSTRERGAVDAMQYDNEAAAAAAAVTSSASDIPRRRRRCGVVPEPDLGKLTASDGGVSKVTTVVVGR